MQTDKGITIAPWLHEEAGIASDPINLLFSLKDDENPLATVVLELQNMGWNSTTYGDHQYIYYNSNSLQEAIQLEKSPSWFPAFPLVGNILFRYHIRLWHESLLDSRVIGGVHLEIFSNGHEIISFDGAKRQISDEFKSAGWVIKHDEVFLNNSWKDSRNLSISGRLLGAIGRRSQGALSRVNALRKSSRDRFLSNGYATLLER